MKIIFLVQLPISLLIILLPLGFCHNWFVLVFRTILLLSYVIPISLRISLDFSKAYFCYEI